MLLLSVTTTMQMPSPCISVGSIAPVVA